MSDYVAGGVHPLAEGISRIREALTELSGVSQIGLDGAGLLAQVEQAQAVIAQAEELFIRLVGEADACGAGLSEMGARSFRQILTGGLRVAPDKATKILKLAAALRRSGETGSHGGAVTRPGLTRLHTAFAAGELGFEHAWRIAETMRNLPDETRHFSRRRAEQDLVGYASKFDPPTVARLGRYILHVVDPELADKVLAKQLDQEEKRARRQRSLWFKDVGHGRVQFGGWLDTASAEALRTALGALTKPNPATHTAEYRGAPPGTTPPGTKADTGTPAAGSRAAGAKADTVEPPRSYSQRQADALVELAQQAMKAGVLPKHGGHPTQVVVTMRLTDLVQGLNAAYLPTGEAISAAQARLLACDAGIIPAVLDSAGVPLDIGRAKRCFDGILRKALDLRDGGCAFPGCTIPAAWTDAHHIKPWYEGGKTSLDNGVLLCRHHHRLVHTSDWHVRLGADRRPEFVPPQWIDTDQQPLRNPRIRPAA